ncbi:MAG: hypothetical protein A2X17_09235 [Bacteroidetes bacterium GWF2_41_61]|jgi:uncharacterized membrane protein|nr:MAG: hypothetical protein A2X20_08895 [Bacteroidetes bacterium GWE2_40_15]OFY34916.1 MAG: hypothetical protein A2X17_09235 [Bacteroidetes bacterium GWF2_41_61]OFY90518.1 MAG: hypothetical protein A2266_08730 [Bacteroidetes bacterium RIFOXYA12_FULL_40_10]PKP07016.1 MAG: hypothetical protein CVU10_05525 [Bacteroidetes bacterium HGW-Bacteroidetes-5]HBZ25489.1 hypothetical protein [Rikenellaceae bacterium]
MKTENVVLMQMARESLKGKWGLAIGTFALYTLIIVGIQAIPIAGLIASLIIGGPFSVGLAIFSLSISRNKDAKLEQIFQGFNNFGTALGAYLLMVLFISLWTLLLIIPGIIAAISYSMTFYILADDKSIAAMDAIDKSKKMMHGYKWKFICLVLRFLGWTLLCILTLGVGFLWLIPYLQVSVAKFYDDVKANSLTTGNI